MRTHGISRANTSHSCWWTSSLQQQVKSPESLVLITWSVFSELMGWWWAHLSSPEPSVVLWGQRWILLRNAEDCSGSRKRNFHISESDYEDTKEENMRPKRMIWFNILSLYTLRAINLFKILNCSMFSCLVIAFKAVAEIMLPFTD